MLLGYSRRNKYYANASQCFVNTRTYTAKKLLCSQLPATQPEPRSPSACNVISTTLPNNSQRPTNKARQFNKFFAHSHTLAAGPTTQHFTISQYTAPTSCRHASSHITYASYQALTAAQTTSPSCDMAPPDVSRQRGSLETSRTDPPVTRRDTPH